MKENKSYTQKHKEADALLVKVYGELLDQKIISSTCIDIAEKLGKTNMTILNYFRGRGSDGYLKDAILNQFKNKI